MTGALLEHRHPRPRRQHAAARSGPTGPRTYLGLAVAGFPNLFTITGPGSPSVLSNMIVSIEQHVDWIADCLAHLRAQRPRRRSRRPRRPRRRGWPTSTRSANATLYPLANSWYIGRQHPRQAADLHALRRRRRRLPEELRRRRGQKLRGLHTDRLRTRPAAPRCPPDPAPRGSASTPADRDRE